MSNEKSLQKTWFKKVDAATLLIIAFTALFLLSGFSIGWLRVYSLTVLQPVFFAGLFLAVLRKRGLGKQELLFLALIFLFGYAIRAQNIQPGYRYFFGFDSYYHGRITEHLFTEGKIPEIDPLAYFELPANQRAVPSGVTFFWYICAGLFRAFTLFGPYTRDLWIEVLKVLPAFFGAIISVLMYFLGKEFWGKKAGYVTAFIAAVIPSYVYRTMAGFLEDDALGFFWLVAGLIFFVRAIKKPELDRSHLINAVLSGLFFAGMGLSWGFYLVIPLLLILFFPFCTLLFLSRKKIKEPNIVGLLIGSFFLGALIVFGKAISSIVGESTSFIIQNTATLLLIGALGLMMYFAWRKQREFFNLMVLYLLPLILFILIVFPFKGFGWLNSVLGYIEGIVPVSMASGANLIGLGIGLVFVLLIAGFFLYLLLFGTKDPEKRSTAVKFIALGLLVVLSAATVFIVLDPGGMFASRFQETGVFMSTVGEEGAGNPHFGYKYGALILFPLLSLIAVPLFVFFRKKDYLTPLAFIWIAVSLVMAWYKLKFTYHFGLPIAVAGGFLAGALFYFFPDVKSAESKFAALGLAFMMLCGLAIGSYFVVQRQPTLETDPLWKETLYWMRDNTPPKAKYLNWWSYGHWITFVAGKSVFADNRNVNWEVSDGHYAKFLMAQDLNESLSLIQEHKPEYILVDSSLFQSFQSMAIYNFKVRPSELDQNLYIRNLLMFAQPPSPNRRPYANFYYPCNYSKDNNTYNCVVFNLPQKNIESMDSTWSKIPSEQVEGIPVWNYREPDNAGFGRFLSTVNNSTLAKLWFHDPRAMEYFEEIYRESDGRRTIKIFKVKREAFEWNE